MRLIIMLITVFTASCIYAQEEEIKYTEYSFTEFFQMIEDEQDSVFRLKNAIIKHKSEDDSVYTFDYEVGDNGEYSYRFHRADTLHITKALFLDNVHFAKLDYKSFGKKYTAIYKVVFHQLVMVTNPYQGLIANCLFKDYVAFRVSEESVINTLFPSEAPSYDIVSSEFESSLEYLASLNNEEIKRKNGFKLYNSTVYMANEKYGGGSLFFNNQTIVEIINNTFFGNSLFPLGIRNTLTLSITDNQFDELIVLANINPSESTYMYEVTGNNFPKPILIDVDLDSDKLIIDWDQFESGLISQKPFNSKYRPTLNVPNERNDLLRFYEHDSINENYLQYFRIENEEVFKEEKKLLGNFHDYYKSIHDTKFANSAYVAMKDLETERLAFEYKQELSFDSFFTWKVNQFLKTFSNYGTKPAKAIIFSVYVILAFAFIYLFFPNHWDSHGRFRIMNRLRFFLKYSKQEDGVKEVYLEEKKEELVPFEEFKAYFEKHGKKAPGFFYAVALPLYKWSVSGTRLVSGFLGKVDVLKGTWENTPNSQRWMKSTLVIGAFLFAFLYDLFIKVLNAVMLSINTFTTLGFGEIPIKGLPRYLAIIQGFIGWFMLTIFSVSLISQLLN
ncbi:ion channel [Ekhidna sp.]|uniref:ion channel n=1 Tax=Ekhidna sp. TaxID=2608089 RepID=UPI003BA8F941